MPIQHIGLGDFPTRLRAALPLPFTMYDSVTVAEIPADAIAVAGYVDGHWPTARQLETLFPHAHRLTIATSALSAADCLDIESGDATIEQAPAWLHDWHPNGTPRPWLYCAVSNAGPLLALLAGHGIHRGELDLWTAHYTGRPHRCGPGCGYGMPTRADATQWTDRAHGRNLDASRCRPRIFHT